MYTGDQQFLVPQAGGPPLIMQPQMPPVPRQPMFTEEVTNSFRAIYFFGKSRVSVNREFRLIEVFDESKSSVNRGSGIIFRILTVFLEDFLDLGGGIREPSDNTFNIITLFH